jgi:hypothetical protein
MFGGIIQTTPAKIAFPVTREPTSCHGVCAALGALIPACCIVGIFYIIRHAGAWIKRQAPRVKIMKLYPLDQQNNICF